MKLVSDAMPVGTQAISSTAQTLSFSTIFRTFDNWQEKQKDWGRESGMRAEKSVGIAMGGGGQELGAWGGTRGGSLWPEGWDVDGRGKGTCSG